MIDFVLKVYHNVIQHINIRFIIKSIYHINVQITVINILLNKTIQK